ncbi:MAG: class I SAM-dependent methyltransferase [Pseudomonadota bacterium]
MLSKEFHIDTTATKEELRKVLEEYQPWRMGVSFSNGLNTKDFNRMEPFSDIPLNKLLMISQHCGEDWLYNKRVLDIGSNIGYNSITLAQQFGCSVTGLEFNPGNIEKAKMLAGLSGADLDIDFVEGDAVTFVRHNEYDLILHLGTLYHLADPVNGIFNTAASLKSGGKLYIETSVYHSDDPNACRFIYGLGGDTTNFWALSPFVVEQLVTQGGLKNFEMVRDIKIKLFEGLNMSRAIFAAEK